MLDLFFSQSTILSLICLETDAPAAARKRLAFDTVFGLPYLILLGLCPDLQGGDAGHILNPWAAMSAAFAAVFFI